MSVVIAKAEPHEIETAWDYCQRFFKGTDRYRYQAFAPSEVFEHLKSGAASLFVAVQDGDIVGACVANIEQTVTGLRSLFIPIMGGTNFFEWYQTLADFLEKLAKENNCTTIEYIGRKGFSKLDPSYVEDGRIYVKEIE